MLTIIAGAVATFVFGALWYTVVFGRKWSSLMGFTAEQSARAKEGGMAGKMVIMFLMNILTVLSVAYLLPQLFILSYSEFTTAIFVVWLGFTFPIMMGPYLWEGKSWKLVVLNVAYSLISFKIIAAIIYFWQ